MSYLAFHSPCETVRLCGPEVHHILGLAAAAVTAELAQPASWQLCRELGLPAPGSDFFSSQILWLMGDGQAHRLQGHDVYLFDIAANVLSRRTPAAGILCWLFDKALLHGWVAGADRAAMAAEIQAALDAGAARRAMAGRLSGPVAIGRHTLPPSTSAGWEEIISFLADGTGEVVTSMSVGDTFPNWTVAVQGGTWRPRVDDMDGHEDEVDALWGQLADSEQWDLCVRALQAQPTLRWLPGAQGYVFGDFTIQDGAVLPMRVPARPAP